MVNTLNEQTAIEIATIRLCSPALFCGLLRGDADATGISSMGSTGWVLFGSDWNWFGFEKPVDLDHVIRAYPANLWRFSVLGSDP